MSERDGKRLESVGDGLWAYLQPDGGWGWSNAGLIEGGDASMLVDTLFDERLTAQMLERMRAATPAAGRIETVVNTHANGDHCWGNALVPDAEILASRSSAEEMIDVPPAVLAGMMEAAPQLGAFGEYLQHIFGAFDFAGVRFRPPTRTFEGEHVVQIGDRRVQLIEVGPAHTRGDVIVLVPEARVVFTGDILFHEVHPIVWAGPVERWVAALDRILEMDVDVVVPGHGPLADKRGVRGLRDYLIYLHAEVRKRFEAGLSPEDAARDIALDAYADWRDAERIVVNVHTIYGELRGSAPHAPDVTALFSEMAKLARERGYHGLR